MEAEESLREAACIGNIKAVKKLIATWININSQNSMNGWTALHWACKRGHVSIVQMLLQSGADVSVKNFKGEAASDVTTSTEVLAAMKIEPDDGFARRCSEGPSHALPIVPNYLKSPVFPYSTSDEDLDCGVSSTQSTTKTGDRSKREVEFRNGEDPTRQSTSTTAASRSGSSSEPAGSIVLRVRVSGTNDGDFVEVEVSSLTYSSLLKSVSEELEVPTNEIAKVRKLPNIWVRKDKDVQRLKEGQELEVILTTKDNATDLES